ncbi:MAG: hypothetical protein AAF242_18990 [Bacteroidota bacterium]
MMRSFLLAVLFLSFIFACQNAPEPTEEVAEEETNSKVVAREDLLGTWEAKYLKVQGASYQGSDSAFVFEVNEGEWEKNYRVRPFRTFFGQDSTYRTVRRGLRGDYIGEDRGLWRNFGDTLMLLQSNATLQYKIRIIDGQAHWIGLVDWDLDGLEDDSYYAIMRKVAKTSAE